MRPSMAYTSLIFGLVWMVLGAGTAWADTVARCRCTGSCDGVEAGNVQFSGLDSTPSGQLDFYWSFEHNTGIHPTSSTTTATFNKPGVWTTTLRVTDFINAGSDTDECLSTITNINPTAVIRSIDLTSANATDFRCAPANRPSDGSLCEVFFYAGTYANFNGTTSSDRAGGISRYQWDFDYQDGNFSPQAGQTGNTANYIFASPGDYQVALKVYDDDENLTDGIAAGTHIDVILAHVVPTGPVAVITPPEGVLYESDSHEFSGVHSIYPGGTITSYEWDWNYDPTNSIFTTDATGSVAFANFPEKGNYFVALRVTDDQNRTHISHLRVFVENSPPVARLSRDGGPTVNEGALVRLDGSASTAIPGNMTLWQWDLNYDGDAFYLYSGYSTSVVNYAFPNQGSYRVALRIYDDDNGDPNPAGGYYESWDLAEITVNVVDVPPQALFTVPAQMMQGIFNSFDATASHSGVGSQDSIVRYEWCFFYQGDPSIFPPFPEVLPGQPGYATYQQRVTAYNTQCFPTGENWTVYNGPEFNFRYLGTGEFQVALRVTDDDSAGAQTNLSEPFTVTVLASPPTPVLAASDGTAFGEMMECTSYTLTAQDSFVPPPNTITNYLWDIDYSGDPATFTPLEECTGSATCSVFCGDGTPAKSFKVALKIIASNGEEGLTSKTVVCNEVAPTFLNPPPAVVNTAEDAQYWYQSSIHDPCAANGLTEDTLSFHITCDATTIIKNEQVGSIFWTPDQEAASCSSTEPTPWGCMIRVKDEDHGSWTDTINWQIVVLNQNDPPTIQGIVHSSTAVVGTPWTATLQVYDEDKQYCPTYETFSFRQNGQPNGATINSNGVVNWTPQANQTGNKQWEACVRDAAEAEACGTISVQVSSAQSVPLATLCETNPDPGLYYNPGLFTLCATAEDQNDPPQALTYSWTQISGPSTVFINKHGGTTFTADVELLKAGDYTFQFIATNEDQVSSIALEQIIRIDNLPPVAHAGFDQIADVGTQVSLSGRYASDPNGDVLSYAWLNSDGLLSVTDQMDTDFIALEPGAFTFRLTVNDGVNSNQVAIVIVEVLQREEGDTPADALPVAYITPPAETWGHEFEFTLSGEKSADRMGESLTAYRWSFVDGPAAPQVTGSNDASTWSLAPMQPGLYTLKLIVENEQYTSRPCEIVKEVHEMSDDGTVTNRIPVADAGGWNGYDLVRYNDSPRARHVRVELDGSASEDQEGTPLFFHWTQTLGPAVSLSDPYAEKPIFHAFEPGLYAFSLTVKEEPQVGVYGLESLPATTYVAVNSPGNQMPILKLKDRRADSDGTYRLQVNPGDALDLDASATVDLDSDSLSFFWRQVSGPTAQLRGLGENRITFIPDVIDATYWLEVWASDGKCSTLPVRIRIVATATENACPVAAVTEESIHAVPGDLVTLDASPSFDADGQDLAYIWTQADTDAVQVTLTLDGATASFTAQETGVYHFNLDVDDGYCGGESPAMVEVTVADNEVPVANAGPDQTVHYSSQVQLDGSGSVDPENGPLTYLWSLDAEASTAELQGISFVPSVTDMSPRFQAISQGTVVLTLVVTDEGGLESELDSVTITVRDPAENPDICIDNDNDGYGIGGKCLGPDCDDTDKNVNEGIEGSCVGCVDKDGDEYGVGTNCQGPDCDDNDPTIHIGCGEEEDGGGGGGGGCRNTEGALAWFALLLLGLLVVARRRASDSV